MKKRGLAMLVAVFMVFALVSNSQAELKRVRTDVFTTNYTNPAQQQLNVWISVYDNHNYYGPDFVKSITVNAPSSDGSVFVMHPTKDWLPYDRGYWKALYASDFKGGKIPAGTYSITVVPKVGTAITETDAVTATFLPTPVITYPTSGTSPLGATPTIRWNPVAGATYYRVLIWNNSWNEPIFWFWDKQAHTDFNSFPIPNGELKPNCEYRVRIEARAGSQDVDMRSRSDWVTFNTGSW
jgi:hypothetical protein